MNEVLFLDGLRTPPRAPAGTTTGDAVGASPTAPIERLAALVRALVEERHVSGVEELILGRSLRAGAAGSLDPARAVAVAAGLPLAVGGITVDRGGCAGLQALVSGAMAVASGYRDLVIVAAHSGASAPSVPAVEGVAWRLSEISEAEAIALAGERFDLSDDDVAAWADTSRRRSLESADLHARDIQDATPRRYPAVAAAARPVDGEVAVVLASQRAADALERSPRGRLLAWADAGLDPGWRAMAAGEAARAALERAALDPSEIDHVELDEGHAAWTLASARHAGLALSRCQPLGGALGLGHLGPAEGLRQLLTLLRGLEAGDARLGICAAAGGDGQALSVLVDREIYR